MINPLKNRPEIPSADASKTASAEEKFQNETLRPIIKMQHDLLIAMTNQSLKGKKNLYFQLTSEKRKEFIQSIFSKDLPFRNQLKGIIIGHFTAKEYQFYVTMASLINKRLITIMLERVLSNQHELNAD